MRPLILLVVFVLFAHDAVAQRVQPKVKTVYIPIQKLNMGLENANLIDSLTKLSDSLFSANAQLLTSITEKEKLLNELLSLADSEAVVIKQTQAQITKLEASNQEARATTNLLLTTSIFASVCAAMFLILLFIRHRSSLKTVVKGQPVSSIKTALSAEAPKPDEVKAVNTSADDIISQSRKRDPSHTVVQLERLAKMLEMGVLTQEEFASQKRDVLNGQ